jgi:hypothetical protein
MTQRSPSAIRASVTVQPLEGLTVTGEAVRRGYSEVLEGGTFVSDLLQDVTEIHAGAEYRIRNVALRAGWWSDPSRYDATFFGGFSPFGRSNDHLTFGAGVDVGRARLELAVDRADEPSLRKAMVGIRLQ